MTTEFEKAAIAFHNSIRAYDDVAEMSRVVDEFIANEDRAIDADVNAFCKIDGREG